MSADQVEFGPRTLRALMAVLYDAVLRNGVMGATSIAMERMHSPTASHQEKAAFEKIITGWGDNLNDKQMVRNVDALLAEVDRTDPTYGPPDWQERFRSMAQSREEGRKEIEGLYDEISKQDREIRRLVEVCKTAGIPEEKIHPAKVKVVFVPSETSASLPIHVIEDFHTPPKVDPRLQGSGGC